MVDQATKIAAAFMQDDNPGKFGALGEALDRSTIALARLQDYVQKRKQMAIPHEGIKVVIEGAHFGDGSATLQEDLNRHLPEYVGEMLDRSLADRLAAHEQAVAKLRAEMGLGEPVAPPRRGRGDG